MTRIRLRAELMALMAAVALAGCQPGAEYADVLSSKPVIVSEPVFGEVLSAEPIKELVTRPREICQDVSVQQRAPERDGNAGGAVAGAVIGGLLGNQVGSGSGRKAATVAGAVAGGFAGREIDRRHEGGRVITTSEQRCETINEANEQVVGYRVSYRDPDGQIAELQTSTAPGAQVPLGERERVVGYDVTYRYQDVERSVRMEQEPGPRLPVLNGAVVLEVDRPPASGG